MNSKRRLSIALVWGGDGGGMLAAIHEGSNEGANAASELTGANGEVNEGQDNGLLQRMATAVAVRCDEMKMKKASR